MRVVNGSQLFPVKPVEPVYRSMNPTPERSGFRVQPVEARAEQPGHRIKPRLNRAPGDHKPRVWETLGELIVKERDRIVEEGVVSGEKLVVETIDEHCRRRG